MPLFVWVRAGGAPTRGAGRARPARETVGPYDATAAAGRVAKAQA